MGARPIQKLVDAVFPLYVTAYLLGHDREEIRVIGANMLLEIAEGCAEYVGYMKHIQTCEECNAKSKRAVAIYIAVLEEED